MFHTLRRRIEQSDALASMLGGIVGLWLRFCNATTRWDRRGDEALLAALETGPVVIILWHESVMMGVPHWKLSFGPAAILRDTSPAGRLSGAVQRQFGMQTFAMAANAANISVLRDVLRLVKSGVSLGITADGPKGPARVVKAAPLDWVKATGRPVFFYAYATERHFRIGSWDRMVVPLPFGRGVCIFRAFEGVVPRRADAETMAGIQSDIARQLDAVLAEADAAVRVGQSQR